MQLKANIQIMRYAPLVQLVRSMRLTPAELTAMLSGGGIPGMEAAPAYNNEQEENEDEE